MTDLAQRLREKANDLYKWDGETMKLWDRIRHEVETSKGSDLPRLMFEQLMEDLAELLQAGADALDGNAHPKCP
jgi:hypothetical protein